jgi:hypothetical protein
MQLPKESLLSRSHMLLMTMLSQRAVDYSIKAYALNNLDLCGQVHLIKTDLHRLQLNIGERGRTFFARRVPIDSHSRTACAALRIYSGFQVMFTAATEIAQNVMIIAAGERVDEYPQTVDLGKFVNGLVRFCTVALFEDDARLAKAVLQTEGGRRRFELGLLRARVALLRHAGTHCGHELAITNCIGQIAEQAYEIAEGLISWHEARGCVNSAIVHSRVKFDWSEWQADFDEVTRPAVVFRSRVSI